MFQMTDATFAEAKGLCIRGHAVVRSNDVPSCWFNRLYFRVVPSHAVELTSAYLDRAVADALARNHILAATPRQMRHLAATIHLCGAHAGELYARNGFHFAEGQRCAEHDPRIYIARVDALTAEFSRLATRQ
jgi:hypothetical protein